MRTFLLAVILLAVSQHGFSQAKVTVTNAKKNFGFVKRGEVVKNDFEIINSGDQPLLITAVEVSCSCTTVEFQKQPVLPGQRTVVTVIFNTASVYGRQDRTVVMKSNDPAGNVELRYKCIVSKN